jgi:hypothetical protein
MRSYQVHFIVENPIFLEVGRLGKFDFPAGKCVYTGSAKKEYESEDYETLFKVEKAQMAH